MQGTYNIYLDGDLVASHKNLITKQGQARIRQILAGKTTNFASSILVGIGEALPTIDDSKLQFRIDGADITTTMVDDINDRVYYKTSLPSQGEYVIYELGCYSSDAITSAQTMQSSLLMAFGASTQWVDTQGSHSLIGTHTRVGSVSLQYSSANAPATMIGYNPLNLDLSQLDPSTLLSFAYYAKDLDSLKLRLKTDDSNYWEASITPAFNNDYNISSFAKSSFVATGNPSWEKVAKLEVEVTTSTTGGTIEIDALRYDALGPNNLLLSRALAEDPMLKPEGSTMDIEYVLEGIA